MNHPYKPLIKQGWLRALLFLLPWLVCTMVFELAASFIIVEVFKMEQAPLGDNLQSLLKYLMIVPGTVLLIWIWRKIIDKEDLLSLGFRWKGFESEAILGFLTAPLLLGVGTLVLVLLGYISYSGVEFDPMQLTIEFVLMFLISFAEELVVRGYLLNNLLQSLNKWVALGSSSVFFALMHLSNPDVTVLSFANIVVAGCLLGINYIFTKNLWFGIFLHFSWNFFQGPIYGYEVSGIKLTSLFQQSIQGPAFYSGGPFGFEGSFFCLLLLTIALLFWANRFYKRAHVGGLP